MTRRLYARAFGLVFFAVVAVLATIDRHTISTATIVVCGLGVASTLGLTRQRRQRCPVIPLPRPAGLHPAAPVGIHDEMEGVG